MIIYETEPSEYIKAPQLFSATDSNQYKTDLTVTDTCFNISTKVLQITYSFDKVECLCSECATITYFISHLEIEWIHLLMWSWPFQIKQQTAPNLIFQMVFIAYLEG